MVRTFLYHPIYIIYHKFPFISLCFQKMNLVQPIKSKTKINEIKRLMEEKWKWRDLLLFVFGLNSGLRISDILPLKVKDFFDEKGETKQHLMIKEKKTKKTTFITINLPIKNTLLLYQQKYPKVVLDWENYIFFHSKSFPVGKQHIKRRVTYVMINKYCRMVGLVNENYWNHTLRKSWWYHARKSGIPLSIIQEKLNHSSLSITKRYLGISREEIEEECRKLEL